jgi:hypothetical protein
MTNSIQAEHHLIYQGLFCDLTGVYSTNQAEPELGMVLSGETSNDALLTKAHANSVGSRVRLLAFHQLRTHNAAVEQGILLGVVVEVALEEGLDVLAVYLDGTARYLNYSGKVIIWEAKDTEVDRLIIEVFALSEHILAQIGPWEGQRKPPPPSDHLRLSFLASDGLYFGEGPMNALFGDPMAGPVLNLLTNLMQILVERTSNGQHGDQGEPELYP